jgi:hypothetical protein
VRRGPEVKAFTVDGSAERRRGRTAVTAIGDPRLDSGGGGSGAVARPVVPRAGWRMREGHTRSHHGAGDRRGACRARDRRSRLGRESAAVADGKSRRGHERSRRRARRDDLDWSDSAAGPTRRGRLGSSDRVEARRGARCQPAPARSPSDRRPDPRGAGGQHRDRGSRAHLRPVHPSRQSRSSSAGGSGLGLAIVRDIVTRLGGTITIGVSPAGGARFTIVLPADGTPLPAASRSDSAR